MSLDRKAMYTQIAESIIGLMEAGVAPWSKPWLVRGHDDPMLPRSGFYNTAYSGFNSVYLSCLMHEQGWSDPRFYTYDNAQKAGGQVRKGSKSTIVVYNKRVTKKDKDDPDKVKAFWLMKFYRVFNAAQVDGLDVYDPTPKDEEVYIHEDESYPVAANLCDDWLECLNGFYEGGDSAYYTPLLDTINMPLQEQFVSLAAYYQTLFHEMIHSSGHSSRLDRLERGGFGSDPYAKEELIAEFGAAFMCANSDVPLREDTSAAYIKSWAAKCKDDPGLLVTAVNAAQVAADLVLGVDSGVVV